MVAFVELQHAFFDLTGALDQLGDCYRIFTVFCDRDPRVQGADWKIEPAPVGQPVVITMSDSLYALFCASEGIENQNRRRLRA